MVILKNNCDISIKKPKMQITRDIRQLLRDSWKVISRSSSSVPFKKKSVILFIFIISLAPRVYSLGEIYTVDEPKWLIRSSNFIDGIKHLDFDKTLQANHPGVTTMWLTGTSLFIGSYLFDWDFPIKNGVGPTKGQIIAAELPIAITVSIGIIIAYIFLCKLFEKKIAFLASVFMALNPWYIAHSRICHTDSLLTTFMLLSLLSFLIFKENKNRDFLIISGIFAGLSVLTKNFSLILGAYIFILICLISIINQRKNKKITNISLKNSLKDYYEWCCVILLTAIILWPAIWVNPLESFGRVFYVVGVQAVSEGSGPYLFMGKVVTDPGLFYYPLALLFRTTPLVFLCVILFVLCLIFNKKIKNSPTIYYLFLYIPIFIGFMSVGSKKDDRYLLPIFPVMDIISAFFILYFLGKLKNIKNFKKIMRKGFTTTVIILIIIIQTFPLISIHPYYLSYFSFFAGDKSELPEKYPIGWGEGLSKAAEYLNKKNNARDLVVAVEYLGFAPFFKGTTKSFDFRNDPDVDYLVFYVRRSQRNAFPDVMKEYMENESRKPEYVVKINEIKYAWVYMATPLLYTYPEDITFSTPWPKVGNIVEITAKIQNLRQAPATANVEFYNGNPNRAGVKIDEIKNVRLKPGESRILQTKWNATPGTPNICVKINNPGHEFLIYKPIYPQLNAWYNQTILTKNPIAFSGHPKISIDGEENLHIVWTDNRTGSFGVYYTKLDKFGNTIKSPKLLSKKLSLLANHLAIVCDNENNVNICWDSFMETGSTIYFTKLNRDGKTILGPIEITKNITNAKYPDIAIGSNGDVCFSWEGNYLDNSTVFYNAYTKEKISEPMRITNNSGEKPKIKTFYNRTYVVWEEHNKSFNSLFICLIDNKTKEIVVKKISSGNWHISKPSIDLEDNGNIYIVWEDGRVGNLEIFFSKLDSNLSIIKKEMRLTFNEAISRYPVIKISKLGEFFVMWTDTRNENYEIYYLKSDQKGSVVDEKMLSLFATNSKYADFVLDKENKIHVVWQDWDINSYEIYYNRMK